MSRPLNRGRRSIWLTMHLLGVVGWIGVLAGSLALMLGLATWPVDAAAVDSLNRLIRTVTWWFLLPCVATTVGSGFLLTRPYRTHCPRWLMIKVYLATAVMILGAIVLITDPARTAYLAPARTAGLLALLTALVLSVTRPNGRRSIRVNPVVVVTSSAARESAGRHRK